MSTRIGILGGSFDPIHYGHLAIAEEARIILNLDRVLFVPAARQPLKSGTHAAPPEMRLTMAHLACATNSAFEVSTAELDRPGPSYTVTTLETLLTKTQAKLFFILGADALADLGRWYAVERILALAKIVAVGRPGAAPDVAHLAERLPALASRLIQIEGPRLDISSSELRRRVAHGKSIRYLTPDAVVEYIALNGLYRS